MDRKLTILIADDEPLAREKLREMLGQHDDLQVVGECGDGVQAVRLIDELRPDLVFLDIEMPELTGTEVVRAVGVDRMPITVFVTAFEAFAIEAFELHAVDYLLKPYDDDRLRQTLDRIRAKDASRGAHRGQDAIEGLLKKLPLRLGIRKRFLVRKGTEYLLIPVSDVTWIDSADNYARLHVKGREYVIRETLSSIESQLDPEHFIRIRASAIINIERIATIKSWSSMEFQFILEDGTKVLSSRRYRDRIRDLIP
jgi:two-component system, LytTR family, response regulator